MAAEKPTEKKSPDVRKVTVWTDAVNTLIVGSPGIPPSGPELILGIEVDATAGSKTFGQFDLGQPGGGYSPLKGFTTETSHPGIYEGNLHSVKLDFKELDKRFVRVSAGKSNVLETYDKDTGKVTFKNNPYQTEELVSEIFVFSGEQCLTGNHTFQEIIDKMKTSRTGVNRILIRLDNSGTSLQDCIMDGVVIVQGGKQLVKTGR
jgi:hypothetical protein